MTTKQNLVNGQGETFDLNIQYLDSNGNPVNLTGHTVDFILKKAGSGDVISTYPATVDASGNISIHIADPETLLWPAGKNAYLVNHTDPVGNEKWLVYGAMTVVTGGEV